MNGGSNLAYQSILRSLFWGTVIVAFVAFGVGGWAMTTELSGAVVTQGVLMVDSNVKKVQHPGGGTVGELRVREGDRVKAGDILIRLDETQARAAAAIVIKNLDDLTARMARLEAERDSATQIKFPDALVARANTTHPAPSPGVSSSLVELRPTLVDVGTTPEMDAARAIAAESKLFELRRQSRDGQRAQLRERIAQLREEITGYTGQAAAKSREIEFINVELEGVRELWKKNLVAMNRMTVLQRDSARLEGERSQLLGATAQAKGKMTEIELQILQIDQDLRTEVGKEISEIRSKISELVERKVAAEDQLNRIDIRAPQSGKVHQLSVHTIGGVIAEGEQIMLIVPESDALSAEVKIAPIDIDQVHIGQKAWLRFSSFNQRITPEIEGEVTLISADLTLDQRTGVGYYTVRIAPTTSGVARLGAVKLVPGMPVDAFLQTGDRTVVSYLMKPLRDQARRAFTER
ncbi:MAG TPA: HlyD family type I secretion periplasmic adaptor subunit [Xanthobacteraceae bacterium]|nr:HlyD family type I secretion periplasmic adaptor subunit [Xanthobacteraceae bacterium]